MIYKNLKELYNVDTISQGKGWLKVLDAIEQFGDEDLTIDFTGISVIDPWVFEGFKQILHKKNVHMKFINSEDIVNRIKMMCIFDGLDMNRIENEIVEVVKEKSPIEIKVETHGKELVKYFDIKDGVATFKVADKYSQVSSSSTLKYIKYAIDDIVITKKIRKFVIDMENVSTQTNILEGIADLILEEEILEVEVRINLTKEEDINSLSLFLHKATTSVYDNDGRYKFLKSKSMKHNNMVGILVKYKSSKTLDEFGRMGKGEVTFSRVAIFDGISESGTALFRTFNSNRFFTKEHWMVQHDFEEHPGLKTELVEIHNLSELGFGDSFLGSKYHFIEPIQRDNKDTTTVIYAFDEDGGNKKKVCTLPERIGIVLDNWGIKYNKDILNHSIEETNKILNNPKEV